MLSLALAQPSTVASGPVAVIGAGPIGLAAAARCAAAGRTLRDLRPTQIRGSHLPPAGGLDDALYASLEAAREALPFVDPDQAALERATAVPHPIPA